jgi:hypothetical protein
MTTAATSLLGLALPVTGELSGTWGDTVNTSLTALLDTAIAGTTTLSSDADVTLTTTTLAANQARQSIILWTAGGTATRTITAPAQSKNYIVINKTSSTQSIKIVGVGPTTGVTVAAGSIAYVAWNGVDFVSLMNNPTITNYTESVVAIGTVGASSTLSLANGTVQTATLTASTPCTFTMPTATAGKSFILQITQAATGMTTATFTGVKFNAGTAPTITATASAVDILSFVAIGSTWYGTYAQAFA